MIILRVTKSIVSIAPVNGTGIMPVSTSYTGRHYSHECAPTRFDYHDIDRSMYYHTDRFSYKKIRLRFLQISYALMFRNKLSIVKQYLEWHK